MHKPLCLSLCIHLEVWNPLDLLLRQNPWQFWVQNNTLLLLRGLSKQRIMHCILCLCLWNLCNKKSHKENKPQLIFTVIKSILTSHWQFSPLINPKKQYQVALESMWHYRENISHLQNGVDASKKGHLPCPPFTSWLKTQKLRCFPFSSFPGREDVRRN